MEPVRGREVLKEGGLIGGAMLAYFGIRNATSGSASDAYVNARAIVRLEDALGLSWEDAFQRLIVDHDWLVALTNWIYIWGHWPVILASAVGLYLFRRPAFYVLRKALFLSGAVGFAFFAFLPVAPPRLVDATFVDTVTEQSHAYRALQPPGLTNQFAAFPSFHAGWNLLVGVVLLTAAVPLAIRLFALVMPAAMAFAVVATANHFVIDVVAGYVIVLAAFLVARRGAATLGRSGVDRAEARPRAVEPVPRRTPRREPARSAARVHAAGRAAGRS